MSVQPTFVDGTPLPPKEVIRYYEPCRSLHGSLDARYELNSERKDRYGTPIAEKVFVKTKGDLIEGLEWTWLYFWVTKDMLPVVPKLRELCARVVKVCGMTTTDYLREDSDSFLMQCAVVSGDIRVMRSAAEVVRPANPALQEYQFMQAWTGILKYHILKDRRRAEQQAEIMRRYKASRIHPPPSAKLVNAFMQRDAKGINGAMKLAEKRYWGYAAKMGAIVRRDERSAVIHVGKLGCSYYFWPWVEATFAKLAYMDGVEITHDGFWLPHELVTCVAR